MKVRGVREEIAERFLKRVDEGAFQPLDEIESIAFDGVLEDSDKVQGIQAVFAAIQERRDSATENLDGLRVQLEPHAADAEYYRALESRFSVAEIRLMTISQAKPRFMFQ